MFAVLLQPLVLMVPWVNPVAVVENEVAAVVWPVLTDTKLSAFPFRAYEIVGPGPVAGIVMIVKH